MSPSISARFPWYIKLFGGRQAARSLHFLSMIVFILFVIVHTLMVIIHGLGKELALITFGQAQNPTLAIIIAVLVLGGLLALHVVATKVSLAHPRGTQRVLGSLLSRVVSLLLSREKSRQEYARAQISPYFWVNGHPPVADAYLALAGDHFADWRLDVGGLVEHPLCLSLDELRAMPKQTQITKHNCIQGWSDVAEWGGVPLRDIIARCHPLPEARYVVFRAMDNKSQSEVNAEGPGDFYGTLALGLAMHPQTILAYEMNGQPLPVPHGAPLRLRVETQLGFKMVKWVQAIEFVDDFRSVGLGMGGWREDYQYYDTRAGI
jgi:DMSO/TMAO reductase YedYZ molybdopterin-dependent catalytic subunit